MAGLQSDTPISQIFRIQNTLPSRNWPKPPFCGETTQSETVIRKVLARKRGSFILRIDFFFETPSWHVYKVVYRCHSYNNFRTEKRFPDLFRDHIFQAISASIKSCLLLIDIIQYSISLGLKVGSKIGFVKCISKYSHIFSRTLFLCQSFCIYGKEGAGQNKEWSIWCEGTNIFSWILRFSESLKSNIFCWPCHFPPKWILWTWKNY